MIGQSRVRDGRFQIAPQYLMRRQIFHGDERLGLVEMIDVWRAAGIARRLPRQRVIFEERAFQRQRPALADEAHIGKRLFDDDAAARALDDEDEIEVAVADLAHAPASRRRVEPLADRLDPFEAVRQGVDGEGLVGSLVHAGLPRSLALDAQRLLGMMAQLGLPRNR